MTHINPRFRAYGKARLDIARRAHTRADWEHLWKPTMHPFAFQWGERWQHCIEYRVDDFPAEVGFFIDVLGFPVKAFNDRYAMFTSPDEAFHLAVLPADEHAPAIPPEALRLQFMIRDLEDTVAELERRGVVFDLPPQPLHPGSHMHIAAFHTPHGIAVELWSEVLPEAPAFVEESAQERRQPPQEDPAPLERDPAPPMRVAAPKVSSPPEEFPAPAPPQGPPPSEEHRPPTGVVRSPSPLVRQPSHPVVPVRKRGTTTLRSNRIPPQFIPIPTREKRRRPFPSPAEEAQPEPPAEETPSDTFDEPQYEDLDNIP